MNELNQNVSNITKNKNNDENIIELNDSLKNYNLSHSIKIFNHKPNNIIYKSRLTSHNTDKKITKKNSNLGSKRDNQTKKIVPKRKNLTLNSRNDKNNSIFENKKIYISNFEKSSNIFNDFPKNNSCSNLISNNKKLSFTTKEKNIMNIIINNKSKLKNKIEKANFKIKLLTGELNYINKKLAKSKNEKNLINLKNGFKLEKLHYKRIKYLYRLQLFKTQENFIDINKLKDDIKKEELSFKKQKITLIEKILELNNLIYNINTNNLDNKEECSFSEIENDFNDMSTDEMLTTKNSNIFKINYFSPNIYK